MHVFRRVFKQTVAAVMVLDVVERHGLETPPAQRQNEWVPSLKDTVIPAMFLQTHLLPKRRTEVVNYVMRKCEV